HLLLLDLYYVRKMTFNVSNPLFDGTSHGLQTAASRERHLYSLRQCVIYTAENVVCIDSLLCHNL
ncbi:hypothetical protein, partial [Bacillus sp. STP3]|uniref:hypothetical protein n=1 Tax=Bacillus sp. STP3 TaxID=2338393 RepID=UPI00196A5583